MVNISRFIGLILSLLIITSLFAQTTYYYKHLKTIRNGVTTTDFLGGQFISFKGDVCYESDKKGFQVNDSRLNYQGMDNGIRVYRGTCYWGGGTTLLLSADYSRMNVKTVDGTTYIYERCTAPSGALTCSLIRSKNSSLVSQPSNPIGGGYYGSGYSGGRSTESSSSRGSSGSTTSQPILRTKCPNCTNGRRVYESTYGGYTGGLKTNPKRCNECGKQYDALSITHFHDRCTTCHGTGYLD